ncbi:MAG TPA: Asp-tRNA(Asn)/Glu-tRNA(Gln) amidotransferase subunit GatB [bacterium]|nr:Asp-tRNA(Asn)/Glu-tRNA(Gln) amidotransferase subunit GatB [bacterium]
MPNLYTPVIGLEVHCELKTATKLFCGCSTVFGNEANTQVCPVCLGLPGTLPVMNERAVEYAVKIGLALNCKIADYSKMDRKNYYYPDLPKAYQISQYDKPLNYGGYLDIVTKEGTKRIGVTRAHLEEDAGKLVHQGGKAGRLDSSDYSLADYNRGGIPLVEIVSEPDIRSAEEAHAYLTALRNILLYIGVSDCNMEEGSLRCDANVSVMPVGSQKFGTRTEIKNMNSFKFAKQAIEYEIKRQSALLDKGEKVVQESRLWDVTENKTKSMRSKEEAHDYRYFPEPDLVPLVLDKDYVEKLRRSLPELPAAKQARFMAEYGLPAYDAGVLTAAQEMADWFEVGAKLAKSPKAFANWMMGDMAAQMKEQEKELKDLKYDQKKLAELADLVEAGAINSKQAKEVFLELFNTGASPAEVVKSKGMAQVSDPKAIEAAVDKVLAENPAVVAEYKGGKQGVIGFLVGKVMQASQGKANPKLVNEALKKKLDA